MDIERLRLAVEMAKLELLVDIRNTVSRAADRFAGGGGLSGDTAGESASAEQRIRSALRDLEALLDSPAAPPGPGTSG